MAINDPPNAMPDEELAVPDPPTEPPPGLLPDLPSIHDLQKPPPPEPANTRRIAVGDVLTIEVLEALPGRPISGERVVRPDGTISLGFYGDLKVAGLTRREAKVKLIELLREFLKDRTLGLVNYDEREEKYFYRHPAWSHSVFIDDSPTFMGREPLDGVQGPPASRPADTTIPPASNPPPHRDAVGDRIDALERKLDRVLQELEALRKERPR
jgi:hypothetical protein